nr:MAG TPA_asm: hypothetical protein [Caudoviricetes sp.]
MRKVQDLTGQRFGRWLVLGESPRGNRYVRCRCDCGTERDVVRYSLLGGKTLSCGCGRSLNPAQPHTPKSTQADLIGQRFGRWLVLGASPRGNQYVRCRCDCGVEKDVARYQMLAGKSLSCGCGRSLYPVRPRAPKDTRGELVGKTFGRWTVLGPGEKNPTVKCVCTCGTVRDVMICHLVAGRSTSCGCSRYKDTSSIDVGQVFGMLTVETLGPKGGTAVCRCRCGNEITVKRYDLINGVCTSCGCVRQEALLQHPPQQEKTVTPVTLPLSYDGSAYLLKEARYYESLQAYVDAMIHSQYLSHIPEADRANVLSDCFSVISRAPADIVKASGLAEQTMANRFCMDVAVLRDWIAGLYAPRTSTMIMWQQALGLLTIVPPPATP